MSDVYVVVKDGVYRHEIEGVYDTLELAKQGAADSAKRDSDDYHNHIVLKCPLNKRIDDGEEVFSITRSKAWELPEMLSGGCCMCGKWSMEMKNSKALGKYIHPTCIPDVARNKVEQWLIDEFKNNKLPELPE